MDKNSDDRRFCVREDLSFKVRMNVMSRSEYESLTMWETEKFSSCLNDARLDSESFHGTAAHEANAALIHYLIQMDEKIDRILSLLAPDKRAADGLLEGIGVDISGSGMKIWMDAPVAIDSIVRAKFFLSKYPLVFLDVFGEVIWLTPVDKGDRTVFHIGLRFMDLSADEKEKIINFVFKKQREAIRKQKQSD